tara:strand:- start:515 stop:814 length:300 start_codon:yes stop_codon:yes gene_type:complete
MDLTHMKISNNIEILNTGNDFKFKYYNKCDMNDTSLGSHYGLVDSCKPNEININNKLCNSLFNNNTKRKTIVDTEIKEDPDNLIINNKNNNSFLTENLN